MRAYHFLSACDALDDIRHRRLKISKLDDLNDPFELLAVAQPKQEIRDWMFRFKKQMAANYGLLCFSRSWHRPALWGHYADKHRGMALGFDLAPWLAKDVSYVDERAPLGALDEVTAQMMLYTKHSDWRYEQECRMFARLNDLDAATGHYFAAFGSELALREVIMGSLCTVPQSEVSAALAASKFKADLIAARLAFKSFRVVKNLRPSAT